MNDDGQAKARELLADQAHIMWAHWMKYMYSVCYTEGGDLIIPCEKVERWRRQSETTYADLTEAERESDREQADRILAALADAGLVIAPVEPTETMLIAARDWSTHKYGRPVGNDGASGCWSAMLHAATPPPASPAPEADQPAETDRPPLCEECGKYPADLPSKLCPGCEAYREHTGHF